MSGRGADNKGGSLLRDLQRQVKLLETDLRERAQQVPEFRSTLEAEYSAAINAGRTATTFGVWCDGQVTQSAVAWVLSCVFLRFCEDNSLIQWPFFSGPGERLGLAEDRQNEFFKHNPQLNDRDWIIEGFRHLEAAAPAAKGLFDKRHNPLWRLTPSFTAATALLNFWRQRNELGLDIRHSFYSEELETRFLGDLYQDLSEDARKTYALLQTPEFVEEFILDLTLTPALEEFGLTKDFRLIDPTCGSGHFLLGAFERLLKAWRDQGSGEEDRDLIHRALRSVNGVDKNPFAVAIARFRLLIAALKESGKRSLAQIEQFDLPIRVAVADSLWHAGRQGRQEELGGQGQLALGDGDDAESDADDDTHTEHPFAYRHEDIYEKEYFGILSRGQYHVVVGNPPYITVKDSAENSAYRDDYDACSGQYALSVPFAQLFFNLAVTGDDQAVRRGGFVGQITSNSFMKREFGKKLIEQFFTKRVDLTHIIDTSGAYIPGHGTPTVILVGRRRLPRKDSTIRAVLGVRGEPEQPANPANGRVWNAIKQHANNLTYTSEWAAAEDVERSSFQSHPWSLGGGGAVSLLNIIENGRPLLREIIDPPVGRAIRAGADEAFSRDLRHAIHPWTKIEFLKPMVRGENVRDWSILDLSFTWYPYDDEGNVTSNLAAELWPLRTLLAERRTFQGVMADAGRTWWEYMQHTASAYSHPLSIAFSNISTHAHFSLDRGGHIFDATAPVIKLNGSAPESDHLAILGLLNSSTSCFWLRQTSHKKGGSGIGRGIQAEPWEDRHQYNGLRIEQFPLPPSLPLEFGRKLDELAQRLTKQEPSAVCEHSTPTRALLEAACAEHSSIRGQMIAWQEELDWETYRLYGLLTADEASAVIARPEDVPHLNLGERAFEIVLARACEDGSASTQWFARHGSTPITDVPFHWTDAYRRVVEARIALIGKRRDLALIERPECKRRWAAEPWEKKERQALRSWLLDRCEDRSLWYSTVDGMTVPMPLTVNKLADQLDSDPDVVSVAALYARDHLGKPNASLVRVLEEITGDEHVPYLAAQRYRPSGLRKRADWEHVWEKQREEDRTGTRLAIPVPPKYTGADFARQSYWRNRGKLDVPKERFISYPGAAPDGDPTLLLGWAGWNHRDQAHALTLLITERANQSDWSKRQLTPLIVGLRELMPWVKQWYDSDDAAWGGSPAEQIGAFLRDQQQIHELSDEALEGWRP